MRPFLIYEKNSQHNKRTYSHRMVSFTLAIFICLFSYIPCLANTKVEIQANSGSGGTPFHGYSINNAVMNSYIDNGSMFFSNAWNSHAINVAKIGSSITAIKLVFDNIYANTNDLKSVLNTINTYTQYNYTTNSLIHDQLSSYFGHPNSQLGSFTSDMQDIIYNEHYADRTITNNIYQSIKNVTWFNLSTSSAFYSDLGSTQLTNYGTRTNASNPIYVKVDPVNVSDASLFRIKIGIKAQSQFNYNRLISNITLYNASGSVLPMPETYLEYVPSKSYLILYLYDYTFQDTGYTYIKFDMAYDYQYLNNQFSFDYLPSTETDYYLVMYRGLLEEIADKEFVAEIDGSDLNININDSVNVTPIVLDVNVDVNDFTTVNRAVNKLRDWLTTGVGILPLIAALDSLDDTFFTLANRNTVENLNYQYTDFYD